MPNINGKLQFRCHPRLGNICERGRANIRTLARIYTLRDNFITCRGPRLFNSLPSRLRSESLSSFNEFKKGLDGFLACVPDRPKLPHYVLQAASNSVIDQIAVMTTSR